MKQDQRIVNKEQYVSEYFPMGAWALIEKNTLAKVTKGGIVLPENLPDSKLARISTGIILQLSEFKVFETDWDAYIHSILRTGMTVGFSPDIPHFSPMPPNCEIEGQVRGDTGLITMHISDILCVICDTDGKRKELRDAFKAPKEGTPTPNRYVKEPF